jgi:hypothetical protein
VSIQRLAREQYESVLVGDWEPAKQHSVGDCEHRGRQTDTESQRERRNDSKARSAKETATAESKLLYEVVHLNAP